MIAWLLKFLRYLLLLLLLVLAGGAYYIWSYAGEKIEPILTPLNPEYVGSDDGLGTLTGLKVEPFTFTSWDKGALRAVIAEKEGMESSQQLSVLAELNVEDFNNLKRLDYVLVSVDWDHGIQSSLHLAELLTAAGLRCVLWDSRGVNQRRAYCTHGLKEKQDVVLLMDALCQRDGRDDLVFAAVGQGYGAVTLLQAAALDKRIRALVSIDAYASLRESIMRTLPDSIYTFGLIWVMDRRISRAVGYECFDVAAVDSAAQIDRDSALLVINLYQTSKSALGADADRIFKQAPCLVKDSWKAGHAKSTSQAQGETSDTEVPLDAAENEEMLIRIIPWLDEALETVLRTNSSPRPSPPNFLKE